MNIYQKFINIRVFINNKVIDKNKTMHPQKERKRNGVDPDMERAGPVSQIKANETVKSVNTHW